MGKAYGGHKRDSSLEYIGKPECRHPHFVIERRKTKNKKKIGKRKKKTPRVLVAALGFQLENAYWLIN